MILPEEILVSNSNEAEATANQGSCLKEEICPRGSIPIWNGEHLQSPIAIDCETDLVRDREVPQLALVAVSDGETHFVIQPERLGEFLRQHEAADFAAYNAAFDFWVVEKVLEPAERGIWWRIVSTGRLHDPMILDQLIRLASGNESAVLPRNLGVVAMEYRDISLKKDDPYRLRFGEIIGKNLNDIDRHFIVYALRDAAATWTLSNAVAEKAAELHPRETWDGTERFGALTGTLQVMSAIALAAVERIGIGVDVEAGKKLSDSLTCQLISATDELASLPEGKKLFRRDKHDQIEFTTGGKPRMRSNVLRAALEAEAAAKGLDIPRTSKNLISTKSEHWESVGSSSPFIRNWLLIERIAKLHQLVSKLKMDRVFPRYTNLMVTGRTSSSAPNIQQIPRMGGIRELFVPAPRHYFLSIDYAAIELRTLAAILLSRFGKSRLADVLNKGIDPHAFTAAFFVGRQFEEFLEDAKSQPTEFRDLRRKAKAINFGVPGGLGAAGLAEYARTTYGVDVTVAEAEILRNKLVREIYPELSLYLREDRGLALANSLRCCTQLIAETFDDVRCNTLSRILRGFGRRDGGDYGDYANRIWHDLARINRNPNLTQLVLRRDNSGKLHDLIFRNSVATLSGRVRGGVSYTQARNTPFQGLAADGAKLALWELIYRGYRVVAFIHDEFLIELPIDADHTKEACNIEKILCDAMSQFTPGIRIECEYALMDRWRKDAVAVFENGRLVPWLSAD